MPLPVVQVVPALVENCQLAPASRPLMARERLRVSRSLLELPVSAARARLGTAGAVVSMVKAAKEVKEAPLLPAASICRTRTRPVV